MKERVKHWAKTLVLFVLNPRLLFCFGIAWMITNGWSYILFGVGTYFEINWMVAVGGAYMAFLWFPFTPEKIVTVAISIFLLRKLFPGDKKTLAVLVRMKNKVKAALQNRNNKRDDA